MIRRAVAAEAAQRLEDRGLHLLGGRYRSIQGQLAAQLRLQNSDGDPVTLYQTVLTEELATEASAELQSSGLAVELWQEDGVFFGLAKSPSVRSQS